MTLKGARRERERKRARVVGPFVTELGERERERERGLRGWSFVRSTAEVATQLTNSETPHWLLGEDEESEGERERERERERAGEGPTVFADTLSVQDALEICKRLHGTRLSAPKAFAALLPIFETERERERERG